MKCYAVYFNTEVWEKENGEELEIGTAMPRFLPYSRAKHRTHQIFAFMM
jgi:hypothetical protein